MRGSGITRRGLLISPAGALVGRSTRAKPSERPIINDASGIDPTPVAKHWIARSGGGDAFVARLRSELKEAATAHRPVATAVARHSMGGQSIPRDGTAITMKEARCEPNIATKSYRVNAGARWRDVIAALDKIGYSPAVMQSNNDFGVGSTFCVNAHGWPVPHGPFGSTVRSVEIMLADGSIITCSPTQNADLFRAAMGGYGLFGVILSVEADMAKNCLLRPHYDHVPTAAFAPIFLRRAEDRHTRMLYGRLSIANEGFFSDSLIVSYTPLPTPDGGLPPASTSGPLTGVSREIYRAQIGSESAKRARWIAETEIARLVSSGISTRNTLMNEPISNLAGWDPSRTDILHEYFVAPERFPEFIRACQDVIPSSGEEILNVTLRYVRPDAESMLAYAPVTRIAAVLSFSQLMTPAGEVGMMRMTEELIDRVVSIGGAFYLPYRFHARCDQVVKAYPKADEFVAKKRQYDPDLLFRNAMWETYFAI